MRTLPFRSGTLFAVGAAVLFLSACSPTGDSDSAVASLAMTSGLRNGTVKGDTSVILRRVWEGSRPSYWASEVSPDGRYITDAYYYPDTGDLAAIDLSTGERQRVTRMKDWNTFAESAVYSPDGRRVAYVNFDGTGCPPPGLPCNYEMRIANADGSNDRMIMPGDEVFYAILYGWSGDDILALITRSDIGAKRRLLGLISTIDGSMRIVRDFDAGYWSWAIEGEADLSPDGSVAAYDARSAWGENSDIVLVSTEDGAELGRIESPADDRVFGFAPDGSSLLFGSDRDLTEGIWSQPLRDGRPDGDPVLLRGDLWRAVPIGTSSEALYFGITTQAPTVRIASFDPETGALLSEPTAVESPTGARVMGPVWSPDGRHLAYFRVAEPGRPNSRQSIVVRSITGDDVREIPVPHRLANPLLWTEAGTILATDKDPETGVPTLFEVNLETGAVGAAWKGEDSFAAGRFPLGVSRAGTGGPVLYYRRGSWDEWTLVVRDLATGEERDLVSHEGDEIDALSPAPDGTTIAIMLSSGAMVTVPGRGGTLREVQRGQPSNHAGIAWTPDSRYFFFMTWETQENPVYTLWRGDARTGDAVRVSQPGSAYRWAQPAIHPDGNRIAFEAGEARGEIWMMTNLPVSR